MSENPPALQISSPFWIGNHYTRVTVGAYTEGYTHSFGTDVGPDKYVHRQHNLNAARSLLSSHPDVNSGLEIRHTELDEYYRFLEEGAFDIDWQVTAEVTGDQMIVNYSAKIDRPDSSLSYVLTQQQNAEFFDRKMGHYKKRTRIDGLPVYLRVNNMRHSRVGFGEDLPSSVTLFRKGVQEQEILFEDGESGSLHHTDTLVGIWDENWLYYRYAKPSDLSSFSVDLRGYWRQ